MKFWIGLVLLVSPAALGYIIPPAHYFRTWMDQSKSSQAFLIKQERAIFSPERGGAPQLVMETMKVKRPGLFRSAMSIQGMEYVRIVGKTRAYVGALSNPKPAPLKEVLTPIEVPLMYYQSSMVDSILNQIGVDVKTYELELFRKEPHLRIGQKGENRIYISSASDLVTAMVFQNRIYVFSYAASKPELPFYPSNVEIYDGEVLKERIRLVSITPGSKFADKEFEL